MKLRLAYLYADELNLYGDTGNVEILCYRASSRNIDYVVTKIGLGDLFDPASYDLIFMGGGPDSGQKSMYEDFFNEKAPAIRDYVENGGVGLFICGSYQLMGHYYKSADGSVLRGLGVFDLFTQHFGHAKQRCVGNIITKISPKILSSEYFPDDYKQFDTLVGFENHGGRTYLKNSGDAFSTVQKGFGNNAEDKTEGYIYKNCFGTYLHGPFLSKNPHIADFLLGLALKIPNLSSLSDDLILKAHTALLDKFA